MATGRELISNGNPMESVVGFSRAVRVGNVIAVGGTAPVDAEGKTVGVGDVFEQTMRCFEIIKDALDLERVAPSAAVAESAGSSDDKAPKCSCILC